MPDPITGGVAKAVGSAGGALAKGAVDRWKQDREPARVVGVIAAAVLADAAVAHEIRAELARRLPDALRTSPDAQLAVDGLLNGPDVDASAAELGGIAAKLLTPVVSWPPGFPPSSFAGRVAAHAITAAHAARADDRGAAHADARLVQQRLGRLQDELSGALDAQRRTSSPGAVLLPPFSPEANTTADGTTSLLGVLRASERRFSLVGRDRTLQQLAAWLREPPLGGGPDHRVTIVHGPGGAGKTRLAAEVLSIAEAEGWSAGFLPASAPLTLDWSGLAHPAAPLAVAIDYAEARRTDLQRLFQEAPIGVERSAPLRILLVVREGASLEEPWLERLSGPGDLGRRAEEMLADSALTLVSLEESLPQLADRESLWAGAREVLGLEGAAPKRLADPLFARPLYVLLDAARTEHAAGRPSAGQLISGVLRHEMSLLAQRRDGSRDRPRRAPDEHRRRSREPRGRLVPGGL